MKHNFSEAFQGRIARLLYQDENFAEQAVGILKPSFFENPVAAWSVKVLRDAHLNHGHHPSQMYLEHEYRKASKMGSIRKEERGVYEKFIKRVTKPVPEREYVKKELGDFLQHQSIKRFLLNSVDDYLPKRNWVEIKKQMLNIVDFSVSGDSSIGLRPGDTFKKRIKKREKHEMDGIPSGFADLDRLMIRGGVTAGQLASCIAPTGRGKCLGKGTKVLMFDGTTKVVEEVRNGDLVMGPDSRPRKVMGVTTGRSDLYEIQPVKGDAWICNDVHVLTLVHTTTGAVVDVPLNEYLKWSKTQKHLHKQFGVGVDFPSSSDLPVDPYFLGIWFGDGAKTLQVGADGLANPALDAMRSLLDDGFNVPREYLTASREDRLEFLAGWLDADGSLHEGGFDFSQKRKDYAEAVAFLARSLGFKVIVTPCEKACQTGVVGSYYRLRISGDCSEIPTRIARKRAPQRKQIKNALRTGFSVTNKGPGTYYGFTLDGDGRFLLGDFTVTHNTNWLINVAASAVMEGIPTCYYSLELDEEDIATRMDARFTDVPLNLLRTNPNEVRRGWKKISSRVSKNLIVKHWPTGSASVTDMKSHLRSLGRIGFYPKLIIIDYLDLMQPRVVHEKDSTYETQGQTYIDVRGLMGEVKAACWTATQGNRASMDPENDGDVDLHHMADSVKKAFVADVVVGIAQGPKEIKQNRARLALLKNRNGPAWRELKMRVDHSRSLFRPLI